VKDLSVDSVALNVSTFLNGRLEVILKERGIDQDIVAAVLDTSAAYAEDMPATTTGRRDPADALARCSALQAFRGTDAGSDLLVAFKRGYNLAAQGGETGDAPDAGRFGSEEKALFDATAAARGEFATLVAKGRYDDALSALASMRGPVDTFFEKVLVMDDDLAVRANRLKLLNMVGGLFGGFARLEQLEG
jgi:glycyl-tRNA synthetase beta chain